MSRIGKKPIAILANVVVSQDGQNLSVKGPKGELSLSVHPTIAVEVDQDGREIRVLRPNDKRASKALQGLTRSLVFNMVAGVTAPFERKLFIVGVGYNATLKSGTLNLQVGYANTVALPVPEGVTCEVPEPTRIVVRSADKQAAGQFAANIRSVRPPEPYKGKGIRYENEFVRRKSGKAFGSK